jgi:hypothetical protein
MYVARVVDTVSFYSWADVYSPDFRFVFPLVVDSSWQNNQDFFIVSALDTIGTPCGAFAGCYLVTQYGGQPEDASIYRYWVKGDVGIVRQVRNVYQLNNLQSRALTVWELLSYSIQLARRPSSEN